MIYNDNRIVVDLRHVQYAWHGFINQHGQRVPHLPADPTVRGLRFDADAMHFSGQCTMLEYATKNGILDKWINFLALQLSANHTLTYTGDKALSIYREYCARVFDNNKTKQRKKRK